MKKISVIFLIAMTEILGFLVVYVPDALAIPAFARKYDVPCALCHVAFPKLNDFGNNFRDNGYQMGNDKDLPQNLDKSYFPLSFRTTAGYEYASQDHVRGVNGNNTPAYSSGFGSLGLDFLSAGTLDRDISFLVVPTGENSILGGAAVFHLESAWVRFDNLVDSSLLNVKVGFGDIEIPFSEHRSLTINTPYVIYHYVPGVAYNSSVYKVGDPASISISNLDTFSFGNHQGVLQLMGHTIDGIGIFRYAVNALSNNQNGGHDTGYYLHVTQAMGGWGASSGYRGGIFYLYMPIPTVFDSTAPGIPQTGSSAKPITKYGIDLSANFLQTFNVFGVAMLGQDAKELIPGATDDAKFWGGFIEVNHLHTPKLMLIARYDLIRNTTQPVAGTNGSYNDVDGYTLAARYALSIHSRGEIWVHGELNETNDKRTAFDGSDQKNDTFFLGFDFAY